MFETIKKPWFFIFVGVVMTVLSAIITNYFIVQNENISEKTHMKVLRLEQRIVQTWEVSRELERLEEAGTTLLLLSDITDKMDSKTNAGLAASRYLGKVIRTGAVDPNTAKALKADLASGSVNKVLNSLFKIIDKHKISTVNEINDMYIEKTSLERQRIGMDERNTVLKNIALFLQIMGLILVLSHGLLRGDDKSAVL